MHTRNANQTQRIVLLRESLRNRTEELDLEIIAIEALHHKCQEAVKELAEPLEEVLTYRCYRYCEAEFDSFSDHCQPREI